MSKEIKFRAWDLKEKVMREVNEITFTIGSIACKPLEGHDDTWEMYDPICFKGCYELMQYTGLKDKNGVEIYEGDIGWDFYGEAFGQITFDDGKYTYEWGNISDNLADVYLDIEVVGNIYENPDLLK